MLDLQPAVRAIAWHAAALGGRRSVLAAVSGIDACGKGFVASRLAAALAERGLRVATLGVDGWLHLPHVRFSAASPAETFYRRAIRFEEMFERLVLPLRDRRSVRVEADYTEETATEYRRHLYQHEDIDVVLLEGIFLLEQSRRAHYDISFWIECSFETALERAIARAQEGLGPAATAHAYQTIYFPAQEIHLARDDPRQAATAILVNDPRLEREPCLGATPGVNEHNKTSAVESPTLEPNWRRTNRLTAGSLDGPETCW